eukprot:765564-Hanusia_phi.AAC.3
MIFSFSLNYWLCGPVPCCLMPGSRRRVERSRAAAPPSRVAAWLAAVSPGHHDRTVSIRSGRGSDLP